MRLRLTTLLVASTLLPQMQGSMAATPDEIAWTTTFNILATAIVTPMTAAARAVGPAWAGLFSAFPTALFPLMLIVHLTYDKAHVHTIIKNFPLGLGSLIVYCGTVALGYPGVGVGWHSRPRTRATGARACRRSSGCRRRSRGSRPPSRWGRSTPTRT